MIILTLINFTTQVPRSWGTVQHASMMSSVLRRHLDLASRAHKQHGQRNNGELTPKIANGHFHSLDFPSE